MARQYCASSDVEALLPQNIVVEGDNPTPNPFDPAPETLPVVNIEDFIGYACDLMDSALGTIYDVPLVQVNQGGDVLYPRPVPVIAAYLAEEMIWGQRLQGADRQTSDAQKERWNWAHDELARIQDGERTLFGQRNTRSGRYVRNTGRDAPKNPAAEGKSQRSGR